MGEMEDRLDIIVEVEGEGSRQVDFSELLAIKDKLHWILFLWNTNSYHINCKENTFSINGGRKLKFTDMGDTTIEYRRRSTITASATGGETSRSYVWLVGLRSEEKLLLLEISEDGSDFQWRNNL